MEWESSEICVYVCGYSSFILLLHSNEQLTRTSCTCSVSLPPSLLSLQSMCMWFPFLYFVGRPFLLVVLTTHCRLRPLRQKTAPSVYGEKKKKKTFHSHLEGSLPPFSSPAHSTAFPRALSPLAPPLLSPPSRTGHITVERRGRKMGSKAFFGGRGFFFLRR